MAIIRERAAGTHSIILSARVTHFYNIMKFSQTCAIVGSFTCAIAAPIISRQHNNQTQAPVVINDGDILNYALTLELLEGQFYRDALKNFTDADFDAAGFPGVREEIVQIAEQEEAHATFLSGTCGLKLRC
jgi:hypothetical protein